MATNIIVAILTIILFHIIFFKNESVEGKLRSIAFMPTLYALKFYAMNNQNCGNYRYDI